MATVLCALCPLLWTAAARAVVVDGLYDAVVLGDSTDAGRRAAAAEALRRVAVRLTGHRSGASDASLSGLLADPERYVRSFRSVASGQVAVSFDATSLSAALEAAGEHLWSADRPATWVVTVPVSGEIHDLGALPARQVRDLQTAADERGLPLVWPASVAPAEMAGLGPDLAAGNTGRLLALAQSQGAFGVLLGRVGPAGVDWLHVDREGATRLGGTTADVVDGVVSRYLTHRSGPKGEVGTLVLVVEGVGELTALVGVERLVGALAGVRSVSLESVAGTTLRLRIQTGLDRLALLRALLASGHIATDGAGDVSRVVYQP